jgi:hypothetical protein
MFNIFRGQRPDVTPAQVAAVLVAGIPAVATLLSTFGIYDLNAGQQDALSGVLTWSAVLAGLLIGGDATLRTTRNVVDARRDTAAFAAGAAGGLLPPAEPQDPEVDEAEAAIFVSDDVEFAAEADHEHLNGRGPVDDPDLVGAEQ